MEQLFFAITYEDVEPLQQRWSENMHDFVAKCFLKDPKQRWSIQQLLAHPLFINVEACQEGWKRDYATWMNISS